MGYSEKLQKCTPIKDIFVEILRKDKVTIDEFTMIVDQISEEYLKKAILKKEA